ncbi:HMG box-containing protein 4 isoform X2 [Planococcus citri]|uniref:HMG box-containing protein 4 isoform X2 n=1 Tax=Planococcus citri TaxID=170843 RepID=UPI0031F92D70
MYKRSYKRKSKTSESADEGAKTPKPDITGVSRSGRVRKKSSKLIDYESGAEEDKPRRKADTSNVQRTPNFKRQPEQKQDSGLDYGDNETSNDNQNLSESENEGNFYPTAEAETYEDSTAESSGSELDDDMIDDKMTIDTEPSNASTEISYSRAASSGAPSVPQKSLYMLEKFAKKKKNGRSTKAGRKDKGKARFSAYMLWAREVRPDLMRSHPNIDFSQLSTRLSDLWATVPYTDKYMWKQKAKRMAMMAKESDNKEDMNAQKLQIKSTLRKKFINKKSPPSTGKISIQDKKSMSSLIEVNTAPTPQRPTSSIDVKPVTHELPVPVTKNVSTQPLDVAAHLKLLGESLSIIGQRLKEHEGQIAVSGSLSVLLDTLLCSLGPLLCLTQQVEEMNGCSKEILSSILDNIAYIMPGL